jgi:hypothetical protein
MPAPDRELPKQRFTTSVDVPKGLWGYYTDAETDALLAAMPAGGDSVVTAHDGAQPQPTSPTPQGVEDAFAALADGLHYFKGSGSLVSIVRQPLQTTVVIDGPVRSVGRVVKSDAGLPTPQNPSTLVTADADGKWFKVTSDEVTKPFGPPQVLDLFALPTGTVDLSGYYTKAETDTKFIDQQYFIDNAFYGPSVIFKDNAGNLRWRLDGGDALLGLSGWGDPSVPNSPTVPRLYFEAGDDVGGYLAYADDHYTKAETDAAIVAATGSIDLSAYAKRDDKDQLLVAKTITAQAFGFGEEVAPAAAITYTDTGEGFGPRLVFTDGTSIEYIPYRSDFEPLNARLDALESKQAPAIDLSVYAMKTDLLGLATDAAVSATYVTKSDARIYTTAADVAAFAQANYAPQADTYTKAEVEARIAQVPAGVKYLHWGGVFQKMPAASAKDKWLGAGVIPSIEIIKGKHYRLEMTTKFGPFNTDVKEAWVGFRFNYRPLNELPCAKQPLVTMSGWGTTTVTRARSAIAATAPATTTPTRADRFRFNCVDDWTSAEDIIEYAVEFEADQDIASANFVPEICFGGAWLTFPTNFEGVVAVLRQMD